MVYKLAADLGGMGFIENTKAACNLKNFDQHLSVNGCHGEWCKAIFATFAGAYNATKQDSEDDPGLKENGCESRASNSRSTRSI